MPLNLVTQTRPLEIKTEPYRPIEEIQREREIEESHGARVPEQYGQTELSEISKNIKALADLKSKELYSVSPNPIRDLLKEVLLPAVASGGGTVTGLIAGVLLHKLKVV